MQENGCSKQQHSIRTCPKIIPSFYVISLGDLVVEEGQSLISSPEDTVQLTTGILQNESKNVMRSLKE